MTAVSPCPRCRRELTFVAKRPCPTCAAEMKRMAEEAYQAAHGLWLASDGMCACDEKLCMFCELHGTAAKVLAHLPNWFEGKDTP